MDKNLDRRMLIGAAGLAGIAALSASRAAAGPLTPPAGAVTGTAKPLSDVEPRTAINATNTPGDADSLFRITQPGSYYLTGNITGVSGKAGIEIAANGVTLELNGFDLFGVSGSLDGVRTTISGLTNIAVLNGSLRAWRRNGIDLVTSLAAGNCRIENVQVSDCLLNGILVDSGVTIVNCSASFNSQTGIVAGAGCALVSSKAAYNGQRGLAVGGGSTVSGCVSFSNSGVGIAAQSGCVVSECSVQSNGLTGIVVDVGVIVTGCAVLGNTGDGIRCDARCTIRGNTCSGNGSTALGSGIYALTGRNRIEENLCANNGIGIAVQAPGNFIARNTCSNNTTRNWDLASNNAYGPIIDLRSVSAGFVLGNSGPGSLATTDPNANFSY